METDIRGELNGLRLVLPEGGKECALFDEFIREDEFGLALHVVCDYLLTPDSARVDHGTTSRIERLHFAMGIDDGCLLAIAKK